jgi:hypothetical protein
MFWLGCTNRIIVPFAGHINGEFANYWEERASTTFVSCPTMDAGCNQHPASVNHRTDYEPYTQHACRPVRNPRDDGCRRDGRGLSGNLVELRAALMEFRDRDNHQWILERLNYRTPVQARRDFQLETEVAA